MGFESKEKIMTDDAMRANVAVLVLSPSEERCAEMARMLEALPGLIVQTHVFAREEGPKALGALPQPQFLLVDIGDASPDEVALIEGLREKSDIPLPTIVALINRGNELGPVRAIRAGASDVLLHPVNADDASEVVNRIAALPKGKPPGQETVSRPTLGKLIAFVHVSGGAGATTLAVNSAIVFASAAGEKGACLLDLDMQFGAAGSLLDLNRISRVEDLIADPSRLDVEMLETLMVRHQSGLRVLTAPRTPQPLDVLDAEGVSQLLRVAKGGNAFTVVDLPMAVTSWTAPVLRAADVIYMVVELSVPIAHRVRRFLDLLQQEGMSRLPLKLVVNRQSSGTKPGRDIAAGKFAKAVGRDIDYAIPNDYDLIALSHSQGRAAVELKPKSAFGTALRTMLSKDLGVDLSVKKTRGLFSFNRR